MASNNKSGNCWVLKERFKNERGRGFDELEQQSNGLYEDHHHRSHRRRVNGTSCWPPMFDLKCLTSNSTFFLTPWRHALPFNYLTEAEALRLSRSWSTWSCRNCVSSGRGGASGGVNSLLELHEIAEVGGTCDARVVVMEVVVMEVQRIVNLGSRKHCCATGSGTTGCWLAMLAGSHTHTHTQTHTHTYTHTHTHTHNYTHLINHSLHYLSFIAVPWP